MRVSIEGLINRLDDLMERLNDLFDKLEQEEIEIEDVEDYFQNDDTFNLSIALEVLEQVDKLDKALDIIKEHRLDIDWFLQFVRQDIDYKHYVYCVEQGDNKFAKRFLLSEEEYDLLKEILK